MSRLIVNATDKLITLVTPNGSKIHARASRIAWITENKGGFNVRLHGQWIAFSVTRESGFAALDALAKLCEIS